MMSIGAAARPIVLFANGCFWPGNDASGPNQSVRNLCNDLKGDFDFRILARDRGFDVDPAAPSTAPEGWTDQGFAQVMWLRPGRIGLHGALETLRTTPHDLLVLNGFFDRELTMPALLARRAGLIPRRATILSPRGEFGAGALSLKGGRKRAWIAATKALGLLRDVTLHATSAEERDQILEGITWARGSAVAGNIAAWIEPPAHRPAPSGAPLRIAFVGRISPKKNLDFAIAALALTRAPCRLQVIGPIEDKAHWENISRLIAELPRHVEVCSIGAVAVSEIPDLLAGQDLFFLPTRDENFGHAIFEALCCGLPCLISDQTPWRELEALEAGYDLPLGDPALFALAIDRFAALDEDARNRLRLGARALAERTHRASDAAAATRAMFEAALAPPPRIARFG